MRWRPPSRPPTLRSRPTSTCAWSTTEGGHGCHNIPPVPYSSTVWGRMTQSHRHLCLVYSYMGRQWKAPPGARPHCPQQMTPPLRHLT